MSYENNEIKYKRQHSNENNNKIKIQEQHQEKDAVRSKDPHPMNVSQVPCKMLVYVATITPKKKKRKQTRINCPPRKSCPRCTACAPVSGSQAAASPA